MSLKTALFFLPAALFAQAPGPALSVDASSNRHPISPYIYSINDYAGAGVDGRTLARMLRIPLSRWGGDHTTRYNWKTDTYNSASDWFFENQPFSDSNAATLPHGSHFDHLMDDYTAAGTAMLASISMMDWLPRRDQTCSFDVSKYGAQQATDPYRMNCGNGLDPAGKTNVTGNNPADTSYQVDERDVQDWIRHLVARYGTARQGGVQLWALDNEPVWWSAVHRDIHPQSQTYDETLARGLLFAQSIKAIDPGALVHGPVTAGWWDLFESNKDLVSGWGTKAPWKWYTTPSDQNAHGGVPFVPWYLQQMAGFEQDHGYRLLDVLDVHGYILPSGIAFQPAGDAATQATRLDSTRMLWDSTYNIPDPNGDFYGQPVRLIPRLHDWIDQYYPGTRIAITEYNWGALDHLNGALAQADVLGIFGREDIFAATVWSPPQPTDPGTFAFRVFLDYDGRGGRFGETSVGAASADQTQLSIYGAQRSDGALTVLVINKAATSLASILALKGFTPAPAAEVYRYSGSDLTRIVRATDQELSGSEIAATFPAQSMTLFVIPAAPTSFTVPQPVPKAVVDAASFRSSIAPGQIVSIFGTNLGPKESLGPVLKNPDMVASTLGGVRVLFDGVPAPMLFASAGQINCVVPYTAALWPVTHVQVEYQGRRSDAVEIAIVPTAPAIFELVPSPDAKPGSVITVFLTGEGATTPPGVDGRVATAQPGRLNVYPRPLAAVTAKIGGLAATVQYAGAAPFNVAGLCQVNVVIPDNVPAGNVPIDIVIGGNATQAGITVAVR